jgi:hypothetical protein
LPHAAWHERRSKLLATDHGPTAQHHPFDLRPLSLVEKLRKTLHESLVSTKHRAEN